MTDTLAAEWLKIRTARSTYIILGVVAVFTVLMLALAWYFVVTWDSLPPEGRAHSALGSLPELMGWLTSLCMAVFGTLAISAEYSSGMIRTTFVAMPRRATVLAAKAVLVAAFAFVATEAALTVTLLGSAVILGDRGIAGQTPLDAAGAVLVIAMGVSAATFAMIGLGLGAITRSGLASIVALALLWYIVPLLVVHVPVPWNEWLSSLMPGALAGELAGASNANTVFGAALPPWSALLVMLAYVMVPLVAAGIVVARRDV